MALLDQPGGRSRWDRLRAQLLADECAACGHRGDRANPLSLDHITPRVMGGTDDPANLRTLCRRCNSSRPRSGGRLRVTTRRIGPSRRW